MYDFRELLLEYLPVMMHEKYSMKISGSLCLSKCFQMQIYAINMIDCFCLASGIYRTCVMFSICFYDKMIYLF